ncbi:MAG: phosphomethylpyrimidine synthase ThiC [Candidatus Omnitrophica bacterium]|nr:phosphomethylpyrimidine synthase ThiC [Candidatus Omnitrophota bacterium]
MKTLLECSRQGKITPLIRSVAISECLAPRTVMKLIAEGKVVIPANTSRQLRKPCGIGKNMRVKVNANIGTSPDKADIREELKKLKTAVTFGADTVMDLSIGGDIKKTRREIVRHSPVAVGTVPIYEAAVAAQKRHGSLMSMSAADLLEVIAEQAREGVDFFTIHCGITKKTLKVLHSQQRLLGIVSRGGALIAQWMLRNKKENPFYEFFDDIVAIAKQYDITLSLGDGLRPGSIFDATDKPQIAELKLLGQLAQRAQRQGVQVMIEGPGHVPINQIRENIRLQKKYCHEAPFYVLGPLVTDIGAGYDHITAAIGSGIAAAYGADFLCFVTPAEHIKLPANQDVKLGVIASKIAAHSGDLARGNKQAWALDKAMSTARKKRDWKEQIRLSIDPEHTQAQRHMSRPKTNDVCTMCGDFCSMKMMEKDRKPE